MKRANGLLLAGTLLLAGMMAGVDAAEGLTRDQVYSTLENMGYTLRKATYEGGYDIYVKCKGGTFDLEVRVNLSPNGSTVWFTQDLAKVTESNRNKVPWDKLMSANSFRTGRVMFAYDETGKFLTLTGYVKNDSVKPADIRKALEDIGATVADTADLWQEKNWGAPATAAVFPGR